MISPQHSILMEEAAIDEDLPLNSIQAVYFGKQDHRFLDKKSKILMFKQARQFLRHCLTKETLTSIE